MAPQTQQFGKYRLLRRIASGGMGEVHLAKLLGPSGFEKLMVIKRLLTERQGEQKFVDMFFAEARVAAQLNHSNIAQVYEVGTIDAVPYIAMEYVHGKSLRKVIDTAMQRNTTAGGDGMPTALVVQAIIQLCHGLSFAHDARHLSGTPLGLIHRDINPHNVLISYQGEVKVIDFGIAKSELAFEKTQVGTIKGTVVYMSPEQSMGQHVDKRSDLFSVGIVLYEALCGRNPFHKSSLGASLEAIRQASPPPISTLRESLVPFVPLLARAMAKSPDARFEDCHALANALQVLLDSNLVPRPPMTLAAYMAELFAGDILEEERSLETTSASTAEGAAPAPRAQAATRVVVRAGQAALPEATQNYVPQLPGEPNKIAGPDMQDEPTGPGTGGAQDDAEEQAGALVTANPLRAPEPVEATRVEQTEPLRRQAVVRAERLANKKLDAAILEQEEAATRVSYVSMMRPPQPGGSVGKDVLAGGPASTDVHEAAKAAHEPSAPAARLVLPAAQPSGQEEAPAPRRRPRALALMLRPLAPTWRRTTAKVTASLEGMRDRLITRYPSLTGWLLPSGQGPRGGRFGQPILLATGVALFACVTGYWASVSKGTRAVKYQVETGSPSPSAPVAQPPDGQSIVHGDDSEADDGSAATDVGADGRSQKKRGRNSEQRADAAAQERQADDGGEDPASTPTRVSGRGAGAYAPRASGRKGGRHAATTAQATSLPSMLVSAEPPLNVRHNGHNEGKAFAAHEGGGLIEFGSNPAADLFLLRVRYQLEDDDIRYTVDATPWATVYGAGGIELGRTPFTWSHASPTTIFEFRNPRVKGSQTITLRLGDL